MTSARHLTPAFSGRAEHREALPLKLSVRHPVVDFLRSIKHALGGLRGTVGYAIVLAFISVLVYDHVVNSPKAELVQSRLRQELESITPLPGAVPGERSGSYKPRKAWVGRRYTTTASYAQIRAYYDVELTMRGWSFHREHGTRDWFRDFGGIKAEYCKGPYTASLDYAGDRADYGWVFSLDLTWNHTSLVDEWSGRVCK